MLAKNFQLQLISDLALSAPSLIQDLPRNVRDVKNHCKEKLVLSVADPTTAGCLHATSVVLPCLLILERLEKEIQVKLLIIN